MAPTRGLGRFLFARLCDKRRMSDRTVSTAIAFALVAIAGCSHPRAADRDTVRNTAHDTPIAIERADPMIHLDGSRFCMGTDSAEIATLLAKHPGLP